MNKQFKNANEFFLRPIEEYKQWLIDITREQLNFVILDLIKLSEREIVICDLHLTLDEALTFTDKKHIVFLIKNPTHIIEDYCNRPDHQGFKNFIETSSNVALAKENCNNVLNSLNMDKYNAIKNSDYFWIERTENSTVERTLSLVEDYFDFNKLKTDNLSKTL